MRSNIRKKDVLILCTLAGVLVARWFGNTCHLIPDSIYCLKSGVKKSLKIAFLSWYLSSLAKTYGATRTFYIFSFHRL